MPLREDLKNFIPKFLWNTINHPQGYVVSAEEFNSQWNLNVAQGDHTALTVQQLLEMLYDTLLNDTEGAEHLYTSIPGITATNVRTALLELRTWLDTEQLRVNGQLNTAITTANSAVTTANSAVTTASEASLAAGTAVATANAASLSAEGAVDTADTAATDAANAVLVANTALSTATQVETDFQAWEPVMQSAVNTVAGKADVAYVDQVAANFQNGVAPDDSIMEIKLHESVRDKLNKAKFYDGNVFYSEPYARTSMTLNSGTVHKILIGLPTLAEMDAIIANNHEQVILFNFDVALSMPSFNNDVGAPVARPHIHVALEAMPYFDNQIMFIGSISMTKYMNASQMYTSMSGGVVVDGSGELHVLILMELPQSTRFSTVCLQEVSVWAPMVTDGSSFNFVNDWNISTVCDNSVGVPVGYTPYPLTQPLTTIEYVPDPVIPPSYLKKGRGTFNSTIGVTIMLDEALPNADAYDVFITPSSDPAGFLGEFWVVKATDRFTVYCSGSTTTAAFAYIIF